MAERPKRHADHPMLPDREARHALTRENWRQSVNTRPNVTVDVPTDEIEPGSFITLGKLRRGQMHQLNAACNVSEDPSKVKVDPAKFEPMLIIACSVEPRLQPGDEEWLLEEYSEVFDRLTTAALEINGLNRTEKDAGKSVPDEGRPD